MLSWLFTDPRHENEQAEAFVRKISDFPPLPTPSNQELRELWRTEGASIAYLSIKPGGRYYLHHHDTFAELYVILEGRGKVKLGDEWHNVKKDSVVCIPRGTVHTIENASADPLVFLTLSSPAFNIEDTVKVHEETD